MRKTSFITGKPVQAPIIRTCNIQSTQHLMMIRSKVCETVTKGSKKGVELSAKPSAKTEHHDNEQTGHDVQKTSGDEINLFSRIRKS